MAGHAAGPVLVSLGDPTGIGPEIIARSWHMRGEEALAPFCVLCPPRLASRVFGDTPTRPIERIDDLCADIFAQALPCLWPRGVDPSDPDLSAGQPTRPSASIALASLQAATELCLLGTGHALVTAPVHKQSLYEIGFTWPGQTEYLADRAGLRSDDVVMMLASPQAQPVLRTVPLTIHCPLSAVPALLTSSLIEQRITVLHKALVSTLGLERPRLAVCGLNPHAGESGSIGRQEIEVITPALDRLRARGLSISGPHSADSLFHAAARAHYDVVVCMYHDQALIPIKTLDFERSINVTLGLPFLRASPDHGTAHDIAGRGIASAASMIEALRFAQSHG